MLRSCCGFDFEYCIDSFNVMCPQFFVAMYVEVKAENTIYQVGQIQNKHHQGQLYIHGAVEEASFLVKSSRSLDATNRSLESNSD